ncbi:MAG: zinc ABC transporter substrate-binding protein [Caldilinea sp.]
MKLNIPAIRQLFTYLLLLAALALLSGCGASQAADDGNLRIVATTGQIGDAVTRVAGDLAQVHVLMGPGVDPHLFVASEGDVNRLQQADVIFYNGLFLEAQMADVLSRIGERKPSIAVGEQINPAQLLPWAEYSDEYDPHVWFDVTLWMAVVGAIRDTLVEADAANADAYRANAAEYLQELADLHAYVQQRAAEIPAEKRVLITAHDAFHYFGRAYGFEVRGLQGISTAAEAGAADVRGLADFIVERQIPALFAETSVPVRTVEALQAAVADRGYTVKIGGELYSDALGDADSAGATYAGMVKHNIDTIIDALKEQG